MFGHEKQQQLQNKTKHETKIDLLLVKSFLSSVNSFELCLSRDLYFYFLMAVLSKFEEN